MANGQTYSAFGGRSSPFVTSLPSTVGTSPQLSGSGSPEDVVPGVPGQTYTDIDTNDLYLKIAGTQAKGWQLIGSVVPPSVTVEQAGDSQILSGPDADPNGIVTATYPAVYYSAAGAVWAKTVAGTSNTGWSQLIGA